MFALALAMELWGTWLGNWHWHDPVPGLAIGAGKALSGMIKRIAKGAETRAIGTPEDIAALKG